ncbi:hypothetical protein L9F63_014198, partial [Diploptera punctata]
NPVPAETHGISTTCIYHTFKTFEHVIQGSPWAFKMLDATSKFPVGALKGNLLSIGNYDECLEVDVKEKWGSFTGRHCMAMIGIPSRVLPTSQYTQGMEVIPVIPIMQSICMPSSCTAADLQYITSWFGNVTIVDPLLCHTKESPPYEPKEWMAIGILSFIGIVCLLATIYDLLVTDKGKRNEWAVAFSWYSNWKGLFSTEAGPDTILVLNGLRFWSIFFVVSGHVSLLGKVQPAINYIDYMEKIRQWDSLFIVNAPFAVDTFFIISGLVLCYVFIKTMDVFRRFHLGVFYMHRLVRVFPVLAIIVMINSTILRRFGGGPMWDFTVTVSENKYCAEYWWSTLLFVQNYVNTQFN